MKRLCDWWMPSRSKCPMEGTERTADRFGAPLRFCKVHIERAGEQYPMGACAPDQAARRREYQRILQTVGPRAADDYAEAYDAEEEPE